MALDRLDRGELIEAPVRSDQVPYPVLVLRLTPAGLRSAGAWPSPESVLSALVDTLNSTADRLEDRQPEKAYRLRDVAGFLVGAVRDVGVDVVAKLASHAAGLP
jgi:hypothetical protein